MQLYCRWIEAINKEMNSIINDKQAGKFEFKTNIPRDSKGKLLPSKLVLKFKPKTAVSEARFKARLVCGGHRQTAEDYDEIFSPVVRFTTIRTLLLVALGGLHEQQGRCWKIFSVGYVAMQEEFCSPWGPIGWSRIAMSDLGRWGHACGSGSAI